MRRGIHGARAQVYSYLFKKSRKASKDVGIQFNSFSDSILGLPTIFL
jgi:hypothetical protein